MCCRLHLVKATEVTAGLAESNGSLKLLGLWRDSLHVTCGLTACTPGSASGPTLGNEYVKTIPLPFYRSRVPGRYYPTGIGWFLDSRRVPVPPLMTTYCYSAPARGTEYCYDRVCLSVCLCVCLCACLSAIISSELHVRCSRNFLCLLPMAVGRSSSGGVVICYVLPVLWMTSYLLVSQGCSMSLPS